MIIGIIKALFDSLLQWFKPELKQKAIDADKDTDSLRSAGGRIADWRRLQQDSAGKRSKPDTYGSSVQNEGVHPPER